MLNTASALDAPLSEVKIVDVSISFRVYNLAKVLRLQSKAVMFWLRELGYTARSASTMVTMQPTELRAFVAYVREKEGIV